MIKIVEISLFACNAYWKNTLLLQSLLSQNLTQDSENRDTNRKGLIQSHEPNEDQSENATDQRNPE